MRPRTSFTKEEQSEETGLQEKRNNALHGQGLTDHTSCGLGEFRPVSAELKLHGNAGDDPKGKN